jgi:hypothetical protein
VQLYFYYIHDQFHSLFHAPSVLQDVESGQAAPVIVLAMLALAARSLPEPNLLQIQDAKGFIDSHQTQSLQIPILERGETNMPKKALVCLILEIYL